MWEKDVFYYDSWKKGITFYILAQQKKKNYVF